MAGTYSQLLLHVVFSTKGRAPWIAADVAARLYPYMGGIVRARRKAFSMPSVASKTTCICIFGGGRTDRCPT